MGWSRKRKGGACAAALLAAGLLISSATTRALPDTAGKVSDEHVNRVGVRLLAVVQADTLRERPFLFLVSPIDAPNAWAYEKSVDHRRRRVVDISRGMLSKITSDSDGLLGFVLAHEIAHHLLGHVQNPEAAGAASAPSPFSREQELAADRRGMELVLAAGFSYREVATICNRMTDAGEGQSSFEGMGSDHPTWAERCQVLDPQNSRLWTSVAAYQEGVRFLVFAKYAAAIRCFDAVIKEFPQCAEGYANRGYTYLMSHYGQLDSETLDDLGLGQIAVGSFYQQAESLRVRTRGVEAIALDQAIKDLTKAIEIDPSVILATSSLGVAHMLHPLHRDMTAALRDCRAAALQASNDPRLDHLSRASIYTNYAVAALASNDRDLTAKYLNLADSELGVGGFDCARKPYSCGLLAAIRFNRAMLLASYGLPEKNTTAKKLYMDFLSMTDRSSGWWSVAYGRYAQLCAELDEAPITAALFVRPPGTAWRPVTSVSLSDGAVLSLTANAADIDGMEGGWQRIAIAPDDPSVYELRNDGLSITVVNGSIASIQVHSPDGPSVELCRSGADRGKASIRVGMSESEFDRLMRDEACEPGGSLLLNGVRGFRYYYNIGLAVRSENGFIVAVIVVPLRPSGRSG